MYAHLSQQTITDLVGTLRHLKRQFETRGDIDGVAMQHVYRALDRVDIETSFARQASFESRQKAEAALAAAE